MTPCPTRTLMAQPSRRVLNPGKVAKIGQSRQGPSQRPALYNVMAQSQHIVHIDPGGKDTTKTIVRAELVGVQAWLQEIMNDELAAGSTFRLLTDS